MTPEQRNDLMLNQEGQMIAMYSRCIESDATECAMASIDGTFNAMIRVVGHRKAAEFAMKVLDRVVEGVRAETALPKQSVPTMPPPPRKPPRRRWWDRPPPGWFGAWTAGFIAGLLVGKWGT